MGGFLIIKVINLKHLNQFILYQHFKMEGLKHSDQGTLQITCENWV